MPETPELTRVRWYERPDPASDPAGRWLRAAETHLPEALPRRFGDTEPLRGRFDGAAGFAAAWAAAKQFLFLTGSPIVPHAGLATPNRQRSFGPMSAHTLLVDLAADDPRVLAFALAFADERTVLVTVGREREATTEDAGLSEPYLAPLGHWLGLPPAPPRWCWFGAEYRHALRRAGLDLEPSGVGAIRRGGPWVPEAYRAHPEEADWPRKPARRIPRRLRG